MLTLTVPLGWRAGQTLHFTHAGVGYDVTAPEGTKPGSTLLVQAPRVSTDNNDGDGEPILLLNDMQQVVAHGLRRNTTNMPDRWRATIGSHCLQVRKTKTRSWVQLVDVTDADARCPFPVAGLTSGFLLRDLKDTSILWPEDCLKPTTGWFGVPLTEQDLADCEGSQPVKVDAFHVFQRVKIPDACPCRASFHEDMKRAVFINCAGDEARVRKLLRKRSPLRARLAGLSELTEDDIAALKKDDERIERQLNSDTRYIRTHIKRFIPPPFELAVRLQLCFEKYAGMSYTDARGKSKPVLSRENRDVCKLIVDLARRGNLSDEPNMDMYEQRGIDADGLPVYHCLRGSNIVELWHRHLEACFRRQGILGVEMAACIIRDFAFVYSVRRGQNRQLPDFGHTDVELELTVQRLSIQVFGAELREYPRWAAPCAAAVPSLVGHSPTGVPVSPTPPSELYVADRVCNRNLQPSLQYLADESQLLVPILPVRTSKEVYVFRQLLGDAPNTARLPNFNAMAASWKAHVDGVHVFSKLPLHLKQFYCRWQKIVDKTKLDNRYEATVQDMRQFFDDQAHNIEFEFLDTTIDDKDVDAAAENASWTEARIVADHHAMEQRARATAEAERANNGALEQQHQSSGGPAEHPRKRRNRTRCTECGCANCTGSYNKSSRCNAEPSEKAEWENTRTNRVPSRSKNTQCVRSTCGGIACWVRT